MITIGFLMGLSFSGKSLLMGLSLNGIVLWYGFRKIFLRWVYCKLPLPLLNIYASKISKIKKDEKRQSFVKSQYYQQEISESAFTTNVIFVLEHDGQQMLS